MELYPWVVLTHVVAAFVFILGHGVSGFVAFRVRTEPDRAKLATLLELSQGSYPLTFAALLVAIVTGIAAAIMGGHFSQVWPWAAIGVLVGVTAAMTPVATFPMTSLRRGLGMPTRDDLKKGIVPEAVSDAELVVLRSKLRPDLVAAIGLIGLVALVWLMQAKPF